MKPRLRKVVLSFLLQLQVEMAMTQRVEMGTAVAEQGSRVPGFQGILEKLEVQMDLMVILLEEF